VLIALPIGSAVRAMQFLTLTIPFKVVIDEPADELAPAHANYLTAQLRTARQDEQVDAGAA
jgi:hypothetical protein